MRTRKRDYKRFQEFKAELRVDASEVFDLDDPEDVVLHAHIQLAIDQAETYGELMGVMRDMSWDYESAVYATLHSLVGMPLIGEVPSPHGFDT